MGRPCHSTTSAFQPRPPSRCCTTCLRQLTRTDCSPSCGVYCVQVDCSSVSTASTIPTGASCTLAIPACPWIRPHWPSVYSTLASSRLKSSVQYQSPLAVSVSQLAPRLTDVLRPAADRSAGVRLSETLHQVRCRLPGPLTVDC